MTAVRFEPGDPPRTGQVIFRGNDRAEPLPVGEALPVLLRARHSGQQPAAFWGTVAVAALRLVARGRLVPGVSDGGFDAWRVGPLEAGDEAQVDELAAAMPPEAGTESAQATDPEELVRAFLDAVADTMPRTLGAAAIAGGPAFAEMEPQRVPELRPWAAEIAAGQSRGRRISLRIELTGDADGGVERASLRAVVQVHRGALLTDAADLWNGVDGAADRLDPQVRLDTALAVRRAARVWPPLEALLQRPVPDQVELDDAEVAELLADGALRLATAGVEVHWPKELSAELTARAVVGSSSTSRDHVELRHDHGQGGGGLETLFSFDWQLALGGEPLTGAELDELAEAHRPLVRLRDQWVLVGPDLVRKARERERAPLAGMDALRAALTGSAEAHGKRVEVVAAGRLDELRERITRPDDDPVPQPAALAGTLRGYQLRGLRWLARNTALGLGGCLADDMGLGKTITLIALHLHRRTDPATAGPTLVVCPASLLGNWEREIERFAPSTPVRRFHGPGRTLDNVSVGPRAIDRDPTDTKPAAASFVLTTYATLRLDAERLAAVGWGLCVADEAQHVKNPLSQGARALRTVPAQARVALTGTPVENNLSELWAILDWTTPGLLGRLGTFRTRWAAPIEIDRDSDAAERLSRLVRPFLLRRRKSDPGIAPELPPKTETDQPVALTHEQAGLYEATVRETMARIRASGGMERRGLVVKLLTACKQICNHPAQYLAERHPRLAGRSGKLELLDELLDTILAEDGAALVFTQYVAMAKLLEKYLSTRGVPTQLLHGGTPIRRREEMVRRFQDASGSAGSPPVFLLSLKAAGTGLNLTRADHVIHYDRWWNPAVEDQATDRAYRIGQTRPVQVHRLVAEGTVEARIAAILEAKRGLADAVLSDADVAAALTELSDAELAALVELRGPG